MTTKPFAASAAAIGLLALFVGFARAQTLTPTAANLSYGAHPREKLDLYVAPTASQQKPSPVLIEIHAGGWAGGMKSYFPLYGGLIELVYARGVSIVSIDYPIAPADLFPAANYSCQRAVQWVRANASAYNLDPNNIALLGCSAGAHLAMWVAMAADAKQEGSPDPVLQQSSRARAVIAYKGPSDLTDEAYFFDPGTSNYVTDVWQFVGAKNLAEWEAIPVSTKDYLSPRWHATLHPENANVRFLGLFGGFQNTESIDELNLPNGDIHHLAQGFMLRDTLNAMGAKETPVWHGWNDWDSQTGLVAKEFAADWIALHVTGAQIHTIPGGTPGCTGQQMLCANSAAVIGNATFRLRSYNALPGSLGLLMLTTGVLSEPADLAGLGCNFIIDPHSPELIYADLYFDGNGIGAAALPIPNNPVMVGTVYYAQAFTAWYSSWGVFPYCKPTWSGIVSTSALAITIQ